MDPTALKNLALMFPTGCIKKERAMVSWERDITVAEMIISQLAAIEYAQYSTVSGPSE